MSKTLQRKAYEDERNRSQLSSLLRALADDIRHIQGMRIAREMTVVGSERK